MAISTGDGGKGKVNADINVTPMIDVMLVLLIIFMIVTPLLASGFKATMPAGAHPERSEEKDDEVTLGIDNMGSFFLNGNPVPEEQVEARLVEIFSARPEYHILHFKADAELPYERVQKGLEMARVAGINKVVAITDRKGGLAAMSSSAEKEN